MDVGRRTNQRGAGRSTGDASVGRPRDVIRIVVTHHPFDLPEGVKEARLLGRAEMAMKKLSAAGADLFLAGHLHISHIGHAAERYDIGDHSALVVQAGTLSIRSRGEEPSFNVLRIQRPHISVERMVWNPSRAGYESRQGAVPPFGTRVGPALNHSSLITNRESLILESRIPNPRIDSGSAPQPHPVLLSFCVKLPSTTVNGAVEGARRMFVKRSCLVRLHCHEPTGSALGRSHNSTKTFRLFKTAIAPGAN